MKINNINTKDISYYTGMKKIVFVAHEFGFYKGHGGIASYLYNITKYLLLNTNNLLVYILTCYYDKKCDLLSNNKKLKIVKISNENDVYGLLKGIKPDYVEVADYLALCLKSLLKKNLEHEFQNTIFSVHHHTASRECFEWNSQLPIKFANPYIKECFIRESLQFQLADINISPSSFMSEYVKRNYLINEEVRYFNHLNVCENKSKKDILENIQKYVNFGEFTDSFNIFLISRIEGRKNQELLINHFIKFKNKTNANTKLILAGNSNKDEITGENYMYKLFKKIPQKNRDDIVFFDFLNQKEQEKIIAIGDVVILPSFYESFSIAIGETILKGVPAIVSKYSGCCDYIGGKNICDKMTFDPFDENDLSNKIESFYNMSKQERESILLEQQEMFKTVTDPKKSVDTRLEFYEEKLQEQMNNKTFKKIKFNIITENEYDFSIKDFNEDINNFILLSNNKNNNIVDNFINNFHWYSKFDGKIIVLDNHYRFFNDAQDIVNYGLPIIVKNLDISKFDNKKTIKENILDYLMSNINAVLLIKQDGVLNLLNKKLTDYVFINSQKIDLRLKYVK